jgi:CRP/FNR family transcriptional regulator, cyclic AMP receptor protein
MIRREPTSDRRRVAMSSIGTPDELYGLLGRVSEPREYVAGTVIFEQGERGDRVYVVRQGSVALKDGDRVVETVAAPGLFGELALIQPDPRALTAVADTNVELVEIGMRQFWVLVHETPGFAHLVMSVIVGRLRRAGTTT